MRRVSWILAVVVTLGVISGMAVMPGMVSAQDGDGDGGGIDIGIGGGGSGGDGDETTAGNETDGGDGDESESEGDDEDDGGGGLFGGSAPSGTTGTGDGLGPTGGGSGSDFSVGGMLDGAGEWIGEASLNVIEWVLESTYEIVIGTPTPENAGWMGIFGSPVNEPFAALFEGLYEDIIFPLTLVAMAAAILITGTALPYSGFVGKYRASKWVFMIFVLIFAVALSWPAVTLLHAANDAIGTWAAPSVEELTQTEEGLMTLGTASIPAAGGLYIFGWLVVMKYALIYGMRDFLLLMVFPYIFPLALTAAVAAPWQKLRAMGSGVLWIHFTFVIMNLPMAFMFRGAYLLGGLGYVSGFDTLRNMFLMIGALVAGVIIPITMIYMSTRLVGTVASAATGAGAALAARDSYRPKSVDHAQRAGSRARDIGRSARAHAGSARDRVSNYTPGGIGWTGPAAQDHGGTSTSSSSPGGSKKGRSRNGGGTQASRRKTVNDMLKNRDAARTSGRPRGGD